MQYYAQRKKKYQSRPLIRRARSLTETVYSSPAKTIESADVKKERGPLHVQRSIEMRRKPKFNSERTTDAIATNSKTKASLAMQNFFRSPVKKSKPLKGLSFGKMLPSLNKDSSMFSIDTISDARKSMKNYQK